MVARSLIADQYTDTEIFTVLDSDTCTLYTVTKNNALTVVLTKD